MAITAIVVTQPTFTVVVSAAVASTTTTQGTEINFLGSGMTGSDGATGRTYVHSGAISANAKVYIGTDVGALRLVNTKWSRSTTTVANDTITINVPIYNTDQVVLDS